MRALLLVVLAASAIAGCGPSSSSGDAGAPVRCPTPVTTCPSPPPRYSDVQALLEVHCSPCHFPGGSEQSRLLADYAHVFPQRAAMLTQLASCAMPLPDGPAPLSEPQRATLVAWLVCGAPSP